jgi:hypothetical protein
MSLWTTLWLERLGTLYIPADMSAVLLPGHKALDVTLTFCHVLLEAFWKCSYSNEAVVLLPVNKGFDVGLTLCHLLVKPFWNCSHSNALVVLFPVLKDLDVRYCRKAFRSY